MDGAIAAIATRQFGLVTRRQLLDLGLSSRAICNRITRGRLRVVHPGVYSIAGAPDTWDQRLLAALLAVEHSALSHRSAGGFWRMDGVVGERPDVLVDHGRRIAANGIRVHRTRTLTSKDVVLRPPFRVTSPLRTLIDLASELSHDDLETAMEDCLRRRIVTIQQVHARLRKIEGAVKGLGTLRALVAERLSAPVSGSPAETRFRRRLERAGLPDPVPQYEIRHLGKLIARVDFAYPDVKLAIEIDGHAYHTGRKRRESDLRRENRLTLAGWDFVRFSARDAQHDPSVIETVREALGSSAVTD